MSTLRNILAIGTILFLGALYGASQVAYWQGAESARNYASWIDASWMRLFTLCLFLAALALAFIREQSESESAP